jgi:hypothetical protein
MPAAAFVKQGGNNNAKNAEQKDDNTIIATKILLRRLNWR